MIKTRMYFLGWFRPNFSILCMEFMLIDFVDYIPIRLCIIIPVCQY